MCKDFSVTYEIVSQDSAEYSEAEESGMVEDNLTLREAIDCLFKTRTSACDEVSSIESNNSDIESARWFTVVNGMEFETGDYESRSLHLPKGLTGSTIKRIWRLVRGN